MCRFFLVLALSLLAVGSLPGIFAQDESRVNHVAVVSLEALKEDIKSNPYVIAVFTSTDTEYATWSNSLKLELSRARDVMQREAPQVADRFKFVEVAEHTEADVARIIEEMGATPPYQGRSGFIAVWRDGGARLYEGQPQSMYLANWLLTLETTLLFKHIQSKSTRKAFQVQDNVRVVGYFRQLDAKVDPQFAAFLEVSKRFHLDLEFAVVNDLPSAKFFKLKHEGDVAILKPSESALIWSHSAAQSSASDSEATTDSDSQDASASSSSKTGTKGDTGSDNGDEDDDDDGKAPMWTYDTLVKWIQTQRKPLWSDIKVPSMFAHWYSTLPKFLFVVPNLDSLTRSDVTSQAFTNFKNLAKQYARTTGLEFLRLDTSIFTQVPQALEITPEDLPVFVAFKESRSIAEHVFKIDATDSPKQSYNKAKEFLDNYIKLQAEKQASKAAEST